MLESEPTVSLTQTPLRSNHTLHEHFTLTPLSIPSRMLT